MQISTPSTACAAWESLAALRRAHLPFGAGRALLALTGLLVGLLQSTAQAQSWERDPDFSLPILEGSTLSSEPTLQATALPDGRVLVVSSGYLINGRRPARLIRFNHDGTIDPSFTPPDLAGLVRVAYVYPDGRVLLTDGAGQLLRLLPDGARDPRFAITPLEATATVKASVTAAGHIWLWGDLKIGPDLRKLALAKPDGGWDETFQLPAGTIAAVRDASVRPDGKLVIAGYAVLPGPTYRYLVVLGLDGSLDRTFDTSASLPIVPEGRVSPSVVVALADGKVLAASTSSMVRLLPDGTRDSAFPAQSPFPFGIVRIYRANASGNLYYFTSRGRTETLNRVTPEGRPDPAFNLEGSSFFDLSPNPELVTSWDERTLYITSAVTDQRQSRRFHLSRVDATGAIDPGFSPRFSTLGGVGTVLRQPDGKFLVSGNFDFADGVALKPGFSNLIRLNSNGSLDRSFLAVEGTVAGGSAYSVVPIAVHPDGKIMATAQGGRQLLNADGSRDALIASDAPLATAAFYFGAYYRSEADRSISRWSTDGIRDPSFSTGPIQDLGGFSVAANGQVRCSTGVISSSLRTYTWLNRDGSFSHRANIGYSFSRGVSSSVLLPDAGMFVVGDMNTAVSNVTAAQIYRFDPKGARNLVANLPSDLMTLASILRDSVVASGGGAASLDATDLAARGRIQIDNDHLLLFPSSAGDPKLGDAYPFARYRLKEPRVPAASLAPMIYAQPANRVASPGIRVSFAVSAYGTEPRTYELLRNGVPVQTIANVFGTSTALSLPNVQASDAGDYSVRIVTPTGSVTSQVATLRFYAPPVITANTPSVIVNPGQTVALSVSTAGEHIGYFYRFNGDLLYNPAPGEGQPNGGTFTLVLPGVTAANAGVYQIGATTGGTQTVTAPDIRVTVSETARPGRLTNVSVRTDVGAGDRTLVLGFVVGGVPGNATLPVLVRGAGPALGAFGLTEFLPDPLLTLRSGSAVVASNDNWNGNPAVAATAVQVGAFAFPDSASRDAALYAAALPPGSYTAQISSVGSGAGTTLAEIYDASADSRSPATTPRLINLSCLKPLEVGETLTAGFVIAGEAARTVLIRAVGPGLIQLGVSGALNSSQLKLLNAAGEKIAEHLGPRSGEDSVPSFFSSRVGAFPISPSGPDNQLIATLPPGAYTAQVRGEGNGTGLILLEIYEVP